MRSWALTMLTPNSRPSAIRRHAPQLQPHAPMIVVIQMSFACPALAAAWLGRKGGCNSRSPACSPGAATDISRVSGFFCALTTTVFLLKALARPVMAGRATWRGRALSMLPPHKLKECKEWRAGNTQRRMQLMQLCTPMPGAPIMWGLHPRSGLSSSLGASPWGAGGVRSMESVYVGSRSHGPGYFSWRSTIPADVMLTTPNWDVNHMCTGTGLLHVPCAIGRRSGACNPHLLILFITACSLLIPKPLS